MRPLRCDLQLIPPGRQPVTRGTAASGSNNSYWINLFAEQTIRHRISFVDLIVNLWAKRKRSNAVIVRAVNHVGCQRNDGMRENWNFYHENHFFSACEFRNYTFKNYPDYKHLQKPFEANPLDDPNYHACIVRAVCDSDEIPECKERVTYMRSTKQLSSTYKDKPHDIIYRVLNYKIITNERSANATRKRKLCTPG